jgi:hypothetical protein
VIRIDPAPSLDAPSALQRPLLDDHLRHHLPNDGDKVGLGAASSAPRCVCYAAAVPLVSHPERWSAARLLPAWPATGASWASTTHLRTSTCGGPSTFSAIGLRYGIVFGVALFLAAQLVTVLLATNTRCRRSCCRCWRRDRGAQLRRVRAQRPARVRARGVRTAATIVAAAAAMVLYVLLIPTLAGRAP